MGKKRTEQFTFFFKKQSPFSNWYPCEFIVNETKYSCSEQFYMQQKALFFKDYRTAKKIMNQKNPYKMKKLGRSVKKFKKEKWNFECQIVMTTAVEAKFRQNSCAACKLFQTAGTTLVESSPFDTYWGIGLDVSDPRSLRRKTWEGFNFLGGILTRLRDELVAEVII